MNEAALNVVQSGAPAPRKTGAATEIEKLTEALKTVDAAVAALKAAILEAGKCKVEGMDVKRNLGAKLGALLAETELRIPRK